MITTAYAVEEVLRNLPDFPPLVSGEWVRLRAELLLMEDVITLDRPAVFSAKKDRPILFSAFAWLRCRRGSFGQCSTSKRTGQSGLRGNRGNTGVST
jgi:hypothetical protein